MGVVVGVGLLHIAVVGEGHVAHNVPRHHQVGDNGLRFRFRLRRRVGLLLELGGGLGHSGGLIGVHRLGRGAARHQDQGQGKGEKTFHTGCSSIFA